MKLSEEDVQKILRILDELEYGEIRLEVGELKLHLRKSSAREMREVPVTRVPDTETLANEGPDRPAPSTPAIRAVPVESASLHLVQAPVAGVFYRAPAPGQAPFVLVGQRVSSEDTVCLLEVMKLFQSIPAGVAGQIADVFVENGEAVNQGQALIGIEPQ
jgi:acetyl-CoA carboxylase biotin carboxyl carrier protein